MKGIKFYFKFLLFFPSVTFSVINSEIFPWAYMYSKIDGNKVYKKLYSLYFLFLFSVIFSIYINFFNISFIEILRSIIAYLNPLLIFLYFFYKKDINISEYIKLVKYIFVSFILFGFIQYTGFFVFLEPYFRLFIPRLYMQQIGGGRGVSIFSSEPSRASYEFLFLYIFIRSYLIRKNHTLFDILYFCYSIFIIKSTTGLLLSLIFFIPIYKRKVFYFFLISVFFLFFSFRMFPNNRAVYLLSSIWSNVSVFNFNTAYLLLLNESGYRLISIIAAYSYGFYTFIGTGIGNWEKGIIEALHFLNIESNQIAIYSKNEENGFISTRPSAFMASFVLDFGLFGLIILISCLKSIFKKIYFVLKKNIFYTFIFYILFVGDIGNPIPWLILILSYRISLMNLEGLKYSH